VRQLSRTRQPNDEQAHPTCAVDCTAIQVKCETQIMGHAPNCPSQIAASVGFAYTWLVNLAKRHLMQRIISHILNIGWSVVLSGCASVWATATPLPRIESSSIQPTLFVTSTSTPYLKQDHLAPTPTWQLASLIVTDAAVQSWTDPNDVTAFLYQAPYIWAATSGGVVRWQTASSEHRLYTAQDGLASQAIRGMAQDGDGHIWVGYADHEAWSEYDGQIWHTYATREEAVEARYSALLQAQRNDPHLWSARMESGWLWLSTLDGQVKAYDGAKWRTYGEQDGITRNTTLVAAAANGRVWAVGQGISTAEEGDRYWDDHSLFAGVPDGSRVSTITVDSQGSVWLAFVGPSREGGGLGQLDAATNRWVGYLNDLNPALPRQVYGVEFDATGALWLYGEGGFAVKRPDQPWRRIIADGLTVQCYARDPQGRFWVGTARGVWSLAEDGAEARGPWLIPSPLIGNQVTGVALDSDRRLWVGTSQGLTCIPPTGEVAVASTEAIIALTNAPQGRIWVSTSNGLYELSAQGLGAKLYDGQVLFVAFDPAGTPWIYTNDGYLRVRDGSGWRQAAHIAGYGVTPCDMAIDQEGVVWLATPSGLGRWSPDGQWSLISDKESLPDPDVRAVALGAEGELWIATSRGLARRLPSGRTTRLTRDSTEGGLRAAEAWNVEVDASGTLWVMTSAGLSSRTRDADWSFYDLAGARHLCAEPSGVLWVGAMGGLYRLDRSALTPVP